MRNFILASIITTAFINNVGNAFPTIISDGYPNWYQTTKNLNAIETRTLIIFEPFEGNDTVEYTEYSCDNFNTVEANTVVVTNYHQK